MRRNHDSDAYRHNFEKDLLSDIQRVHFGASVYGTKIDAYNYLYYM